MQEDKSASYPGAMASRKKFQTLDSCLGGGQTTQGHPKILRTKSCGSKFKVQNALGPSLRTRKTRHTSQTKPYIAVTLSINESIHC